MLEEHIEPFASMLRTQHYRPETVTLYLRLSRDFLAYVTRRAFTPADLDVGYARAYLARRQRVFDALHAHPMHPSYLRILRAALNRFLRYLACTGACPNLSLAERTDLRSVPGHQALLGKYEQYLLVHRGLAAATVHQYLDHASGLCRLRGAATGSPWDDLPPRLLYTYLLNLARTRTHDSLRSAISALRSFFRFLHITGQCARRLELYFVPYRAYTRSRLPAIVSTEDLYRIFETVRGNSPREIAHRAVLLLLTLHGLRAGEVAHLRLEDIHWRQQAVVVRRRKCGRDLLLPLHPAAASALAQYLREVRPRGTPYREVFLTRLPPPRPYPLGGALTEAIVWHLRKHGIRLRPHGLRHALATRLLNHDCPPEWIQLLLGHATFDSTRVYARTDLAHLRQVAEEEGGPHAPGFAKPSPGR
jgi:site-specific recombinase XerD